MGCLLLAHVHHFVHLYVMCRRDPLTSRELRPEQISPNLALYRAIEEWIESCKQMLEKQAQQQQLQQQDQQAGKVGAQEQQDKGRRRSFSSRRGSIDTGTAPDAADQAAVRQQQQPAAPLGAGQQL